MVNLWLGELNPCVEYQQSYFQWLDEEEKRHVAALHNDAIRSRYVQVHGQLRLILGELVNEQPEKLRFDKSAHGKPYLVDFPDVEFNLSHTADHFAIAATYNCLLGVDIEACKSRANFIGLVNKCFADEEKFYWQQLPESVRVKEFYRLWTRKEAFVKATGQGIQLGLNQCVVNPKQFLEFLRIPEGYGEIRQWFIHQIDVSSTFQGALVLKNINQSSTTKFHIALKRI